MFNRLPPELVRQVIESSVPSTCQILRYEDRQTLLRSLCLVCRLFRKIAQPLLFEIVWINCQRRSQALLNTLESTEPTSIIRQAVFGDQRDQRRLDTEYLQRILRRCQGLRSLILQPEYSGPLDLSLLQDLPYLADLTLFGSDCQFPSSSRLHALTSLRIGHTSIKVAPSLLDPVVLPSLRSLAMFNIYNDADIAYLNRSRLDQLLPQLESLFLDSCIIQRGLGYLIPALPRTLFEFYPPSSEDRIDPLRVAQHLRIQKRRSYDFVIRMFVVSIKNQHRQISLRSLSFDIKFKDLSSLPVDSVKAVQDLLRVCKEKGIEVIYEDQEVGFACEERPSEEFRRRQREIRKLEATSE